MIRAAMYARVSSDRQEHEETIHSQLAELRARAQQDGVQGCAEFIDEGYGRDNLVRPNLDRLRDLAAAGDFDRVYVQSPDRLASGAKLMLLVDELRERSAPVVFLKGSVEDTSEGKLLLHMQGAIAEYERAKIAERTRRGKLYWARQGAFVGGHAPFGYRLMRRSEGQRARFEMNPYEATVVREMYRWLVEERLSTRAIVRRLTERGVPTPTGNAQWQPTTVDRILRNPTYKGTYFYQRAESVEPSSRRSADRYNKRRKSGRRPRPQEDWIGIPVPSIVKVSLWEEAQRQLVRNGENARRNNKRHQYLLRGLIKCPRCGSTYTGYCQHGSRGYRCTNSSSAIPNDKKKCPPGSVMAQPVEDAVWEGVKEAFQRPDVLVREYRRRIEDAGTQESLEAERKQVQLALKRLKIQEDRVTSAYINEVMELDRYREEMEKLRRRRKELEKASRDIDRRAQQETDSRKALDGLERFCQTVGRGLDSMTFEERQQLLRLVVERIVVDDGRIRIDTIIPTGEDGNLRTRRPEPVEA